MRTNGYSPTEEQIGFSIYILKRNTFTASA